MRCFFSLLFILLCFTFTPVLSQSFHCGYVEAMQARESRNSGYIERCNKAFREMKQQAPTRTNDVYKIKVVFHAIHNDQGQFLPDSVFHNQIAVLNQDYRRLNADTINTRAEFKPVAGDAQIEFVLADTDPQGNPTNGIHRVQSATSFSLAPFNDNVKQSSQGGVDAWDTRYYLNIWVCDMSLPVIGPAVLGYAYPPNNLPNWPANSGATAPELEGVVIHFQAIGSNNPLAGTLANLVDRGRTATHEIGHFLGLRHIWGDGDCTQDDGIDDTPDATDNAQQQCDWSKNTCTESTGAEFPDMIENYMDYAADSCMNLFTQKQIDLMRAVLEGPRQDLIAWNLTHIGETHEIHNLTLSPNPAQQILHLSWEALTPTTYDIQVFDMMGRTVISPVYTQSATFDIDLQGLDSGFYILSLRTESGYIVNGN